MPQARLVTPIALVLLLPGCGPSVAGARASVVPGAGPAAASLATPPERGDATGGPTGAQAITFGDDDVETEPTTQIRSAPRRPPIPSFELFGTRKSDGP